MNENEQFSSQSRIQTVVCIPHSRMVELVRTVDPSIAADAIVEACGMSYDSTGGVKVTVAHTQQPVKNIPQIGLLPALDTIVEAIADKGRNS